ncbi:MAG: hypothetical protein FJ290_29965, partial [Planctomycetes bacterium]|nr:hypothetical protein [Planctomycetota bacterium]
MTRASAWFRLGRVVLAWALWVLGAGAWAEEPRPGGAPEPKVEEEPAPPPRAPATITPPNPPVRKLEAELSRDLLRGARRLAATLAGHKGAVDSVAVSPDGLSLASAGSDGTVRVWDGATGECLHVLRDPRRLPPIRIAFFPGEPFLWCRGADGRKRFWHLGENPPMELPLADGLPPPPEMDAAARAKLLGELGEHAKGVTAVAASRSGRRILTGSADGAVRLWVTGPPDALEEHWLDEPARRRLAATMRKKVTFDFVETPLADVVNFLSSLVDITIVLDPRAVKDDTPTVTLRVQEMRFEEALGRIGGLAKMIHVPHQSALLVTSAERAKTLKGESEEVRLFQWPDGADAAAQMPRLLRSVTFDFIETPHQDVFNFLQSLVDVPIFPDPQALKEEVPNVTLRVSEMRLHCAMRWICQGLDRVFVWHDGALWVTTLKRARDTWRFEHDLAAFQEPPSPELAKKMEQAVRLDFVEVPLAQALERVSREAGVPIELAAEAGEVGKKAVSLRADGMAAGRVLRWVCRSVGLAHVWRGPEIAVAEPGRVRETIGTEADNPAARRLHAALKARNPRYQRNAALRFRGGELDGLGLNGRHVSDLSPLKGLRLRRLECRDNHLSDLSPLAGMALEELDCSDNEIADLSPLRGMPLKLLDCARNKVSDLSPLAGLPLERLDCGSNPVADLAPLRNVPLRRLELWKTAVTDLAPLKGTQLEELGLGRLAIADLSPLLALPLKRLAFPPERPGADLTPFETHKALEAVGFDCPLGAAAAPPAILRLSREVAGGAWRLAATLSGHEGGVDALFVTPDGLRVISGGRDGTIRSWDAATGGCIRTQKGLRPPVQLALSWNGAFLYTRDAAGAVKLWDAATGDCLKTYPAGSKDEAFEAKAPDKEKLLKPLGSQAEGATAVAASRDGRCIATGGADGALRLWAIGPLSPIEERRLDEPLRKRLAAALDKKVTLDLTGATMEDAIGGIRKAAGANVAIDPQAFGNEDPKFTVRLNDRPASDALKKVCDAAGLVQLECDGVLLLTSPARVAAVRGPIEATRALQWPRGDELAPWLRRMANGVSFDFVCTPVPDVLTWLGYDEESGGFTILLDPQAATNDVLGVTARVENVRLASALRLVCRLMGMVYLWLDGGILVTTPERVKEVLRQEEAQAPLHKPPTAELAKQMAKPISFEFIQEPLSDVLTRLSKECDVSFILDAKEGKREVTVWGNQMPLERALRWVCRASGMAY